MKNPLQNLSVPKAVSSRLSGLGTWVSRHQRLTVALVMAIGLIAAFSTFASGGNCNKNEPVTIVGKQVAQKPGKCDNKGGKKNDNKNSKGGGFDQSGGSGRVNPAGKPNQPVIMTPGISWVGNGATMYCLKDNETKKDYEKKHKNTTAIKQGEQASGAGGKVYRCTNGKNSNGNNGSNGNGGNNGQNGTTFGPVSGSAGKQNAAPQPQNNNGKNQGNKNNGKNK